MRPQTHEYLTAARDKEEVADDRVFELFRFRAVGIDIPIGAKSIFDRLTHRDHFVEVVPRWWQQYAEDKVSIAGRQIFDLRPEVPRRPGGYPEQYGDHGHLPQHSVLNPAVDFDDRCDEPSAHQLDGADNHRTEPVERLPKTAVRPLGVAVVLRDQAGAGRWDDGDRDDGRQHDGSGDRKGDVAKELAGFFLHE